MSKQTFIQGTLILIMAGFVTRFLGFINRIIVARIMGAEGVGLYVMAVPTMLLVITLTQFGLPVAISKLVDEAEAMGDRKKVKSILVVSLSITAALSVLFTTAIIVFAPMIAKTLLTDSRTYYPLIAIAPIVPIVALSSVLRGYFQGKQNMRPTAYSQMLEQIVRISFVALFTTMFLPYGVEYAAAGAMISVVIGELASLIYMLFLFKINKQIKMRKNFFRYLYQGKETTKELLAIALPTTGSRLIGSVSYFFEPIVVSQSLALAGVATVVATSQYGKLAGFVIPLITLPTFITYSLSVSLVPAISEARAMKKYDVIHYRLNQALRLAFISGGISAVILYIFAVPIMDLMYHAPEAAVFVKVIAPFSIFLYFQGPLQAALQALDMAKAAMMNSFYGALVKMAAIFLLASRPELGIMGAALAIVIGFVLVTLLHFASIAKTISFTLDVKQSAKTTLAIIITAIISFFIAEQFTVFEHLFFSTSMAIFLTLIIYCLFLIAFRIVQKDELKRLPVIGKLFA